RDRRRDAAARFSDRRRARRETRRPPAGRVPPPARPIPPVRRTPRADPPARIPTARPSQRSPRQPRAEHREPSSISYAQLLFPDRLVIFLRPSTTFMTKPASDSVADGVIDVLKNVSRRPIEPALSSDLVADLGFDSLQVLEVIAELEDRFDISI